MNSPYMGRFRVSQQFSQNHTGLDLVGIDSKEIHSTVNGKVVRAGWENDANHKQGFGQRVVIQQSGTNKFFYFGHLSEIKVKAGDEVKVTDVIGIEGNTGYSTGSHCHYECRLDDTKARAQNISAISGIPNRIGTYDDGYKPPQSVVKEFDISFTLDGKTYTGKVKEV